VILLRWVDFRFAFNDDKTPDIDGVPVWPDQRVRDNGFDGGFSGIARPITAFPLTVSVDSEAVTTVDAFHWYISQRTDDASLQWLALSQSNPAQSGTVTISLTSKCVTDIGLDSATDPLSPDELREILKNVDLYVVRNVDFSIQWLSMLQHTLSPY
jgi:hypothetical protein